MQSLTFWTLALAAGLLLAFKLYELWLRFKYGVPALKAVETSEVHRRKAAALSQAGRHDEARAELTLAQEIIGKAQADLERGA